ncbi:NAD(P)H-dependent glycerol-3-phosphate dehydrogenase [Vampirovibrio sp.]|uniref:NAD(P)H-dependent glycerol-3-phosphate dehydrogenase n=1 Tax=Vampirovibrio sp. TaxID=2717857 RepID=UPI0035946F76
MKKLAILGAGSWGLTLAWLTGGSHHNVWLWDRNPAKVEAMQRDRKVLFPVPVLLPQQLNLTASLAEAVQDADVILLVVTVSGTREVLHRLRDEIKLPKTVVLVNASKGIEFPSLKRMSEVFAEELPENPYAVLSGPTLALEILNGLPTACSIACQDLEIAERLQQDLSHDLFRLYSNTDVTGVELGGALKNIFAIASGYMKEKQLGDNAVGALITRGLAEMTRFSVGLGADQKTLYGMSGLGDLLATANSPLSRNFQVGARLARGESLSEILTDLKVVAEGVKTTHAVYELSRKIGLDTPIVDMVEMCLSGPFSEKMIVKSLMTRKLKSEQKETSQSG